MTCAVCSRGTPAPKGPAHYPDELMDRLATGSVAVFGKAVFVRRKI
jgi:hypothetical protein